MTRTVSFSFTAAGVHACSGNCFYCSAASSMDYSFMNLKNKDKLKDNIIKTDAKAYDELKADFNKCEETFDHDPQIVEIFEARKKDPSLEVIMKVDLWGADPLTCKSVLDEMLAFLQDYSAKRNFKLDVHTSTNGLPLLIDEYAEWLIQNNIGLQLSHDGLGQWIRTQEIDPMEFANTQALIKGGTLNWINATLNFWNPSLFKNIAYFTNYLKKIFPDVYAPDKFCTPEDDRVFRALFIKLNHIYDGDYNLKALNKRGLFNGVEYDSLKNAPIGDLAFRNDYELAERYNVPGLARVLDEHIAEWEKLSYDVEQDFPIILPFKEYIRNQLTRNSFYKSHREENAGACRAFQQGLRKHTFVIDTLGNYSQCNLIDSEHSVENPECKQAPICKGCRFEFAEACNGCGSVMPRQKDCNYLYAWNCFIERYTMRKNHENMIIDNYLQNLINTRRQGNGCNCNSHSETKRN